MRKIILYICMTMSVFALTVGCADKKEDALLVSASEEKEEAGVSSGSASEESGNGKKYIYVYICGAVKHPGVFRLKNGSRVYQVLKKAGGFSSKASRKSVNLAEIVSDGQMVVVPDRTEAAEGSSGSSQTGDSSQTVVNKGNKVNINTASAEELTSLSGIGEAKAKAIVTYREESGTFQKPEDIMNVSGIGEATYSNIKEDITV